MASVTVLGSLNVDTSVGLQRFPAAGETVAAHRLDYLPGGKGLNQAVAAARMGAQVRMVGAIGADWPGDELLRQLKAEPNLDISHVQHVIDTRTGQAIVMTEQSGENRIVVIAGANGAVVEAFVIEALDSLTRGDLLVCQLEIPLGVVAEGLRLASEQGAMTILNAAPAGPVGPLLDHVDLLIVNESEARSLLPGQGHADGSQMAARLHELHGTDVVVTCGARGVTWSTSDGRGELDAFEVSVVDTTGAGDAFVGAVAAFLAEERPLRDALEFAAAVGATACTHVGAQSYPETRADVLAAFDLDFARETTGAER
jgi:ribokinase